MVKDGNLEGLAHLMNSVESRHVFQNWDGTRNASMSFLKLLEPWILHDNAIPLRSRTPGKELPLNCLNPAYSGTLSGEMLRQQRMVVDFVPFGYDVDKLLVRFHETAAYVDVFVVYEMPYTLLGNAKSLFYERIRHQPRFEVFQHKVIYVNPDKNGMNSAVESTRAAIDRFFAKSKTVYNENGIKMGNQGQKGESSYLEPAIYSVMHFFNKDLVQQFNKIGTFPAVTTQEKLNIELKGKVMKYMRDGGEVFAIQNDGDELVNGKVLRHLRHCKIKPEVKSIFTPCFGFKNNYHWLQTTFDMRHFTSGQTSARGVVDIYKYLKMVQFGHFFGNGLQMELNKFIWRLGPYLWPLQTIIDEGSMLRRNFTNDRFFNHHMGYGAATHMSGVNEPAELWYKACGTVEMVGACGNSISPKLREAAIKGVVTSKLIFENTVFPWCHRWNKAVHKSTLSRRANRVVLEAIPWVVRNNPAAFPFMLPVSGLHATGLYETVADPKWARECGDEPVGIVDT